MLKYASSDLGLHCLTMSRKWDIRLIYGLIFQDTVTIFLFKIDGYLFTHFTGMFFPYLYSNTWEDGISVRILEGQLFDQLLLSLYKLEKEGTIVRHKTYAFARNQRPRTGCYKLADKEVY